VLTGLACAWQINLHHQERKIPMKTLATMVGLFSILITSAAFADKVPQKAPSASVDVDQVDQAAIELQSESIKACCNKNESGGLTGCFDAPATGGCPGSQVAATCTSRDVSGYPTSCTEDTGS